MEIVIYILVSISPALIIYISGRYTNEILKEIKELRDEVNKLKDETELLNE